MSQRSDPTINYDAFGFTLSRRIVSIGGLLFAKKLCKNLRLKLDSDVSRGRFYLDSWANSEDSRSLNTSILKEYRGSCFESSCSSKTIGPHVSMSFSSKRFHGSSYLLSEATGAGTSENSFCRKMEKVRWIFPVNSHPSGFIPPQYN